MKRLLLLVSAVIGAQDLQPKIYRNLIPAQELSGYAPKTLLSFLGSTDIRVYLFKPDVHTAKFPQQTVRMSVDTFLSQQPNSTRLLQFRQEFESLTAHPVLEPLALYLQKKLGSYEICHPILRISLQGWKFPFHFDASDNLFVQLYGSRTIFLLPYDIGIKYVHRWDTEHYLLLKQRDIQQSLQTITLNAGDALVIPAGWFHYMAINEPQDVALSCIFKRKNIDYSLCENRFAAAYPVQQSRLHVQTDMQNIVRS